MSEYGRRVKLSIILDLWEWPKGRLDQSMDITKDVLSYTFQKTIKSPEGVCQLSILPQRDGVHILDTIKIMDVIKIYEFDTLKYIGYVTRESYSGAINTDGSPSRGAVIQCAQMGGLLLSASMGLGMGTLLGKPEEELSQKTAELSVALEKASDDGSSFGEVADLTLTAFFDYIVALGGSGLMNYINEYIDTSVGIQCKKVSGLPKTYELMTGTEESINIWDVLSQMVERPFNELWVDNGPRTVQIDGEGVNLGGRSCLVFRPTPFDGTVTDGKVGKAFDALPVVKIDKDHLISFDLARSLDEVYTVYNVKSPAFLLNDIVRILLGIPKVDNNLIGQYLMKPMVVELFFTRLLKKEGDAVDLIKSKAEKVATEAATTLYNWYYNNANTFSGVVSMMVPTDSSLDPCIGDKIEIYGIEGQFYVEGISHSWSYQGPMKSDLSITRGIGKDRTKLIDSVFVNNPIGMA